MQSPKPEAHDKVLDNNSDRIGIWKCRFLRKGENRSNNNKLNPHICVMLSPGIEPGPHLWETSALTTVPSLLP